MKIGWAFFLTVAIMASFLPVVAAQSPTPVPKYDPSSENVFKGVVDEVRDRQCPVSGGMGSHVVLKLQDGTLIEVHLASAKFVRSYDLVFVKGDEIEVTGSKVKFEGVDTIFAREVKRGNDTFLFRDKDGKPVW